MSCSWLCASLFVARRYLYLSKHSPRGVTGFNLTTQLRDLWGFETSEVLFILRRTRSDAPSGASTLLVYDESTSRSETHPMLLRERRVRNGRETKIEVKIQSDRKNHSGHNRHCRSRGRRSLRNLHAILPSSSNRSSNSKPSAELWNSYTGRRIDIQPSHSCSRPALRNNL
jgi:hypothetical protein